MREIYLLQETNDVLYSEDDGRLYRCAVFPIHGCREDTTIEDQVTLIFGCVMTMRCDDE